MTEFVAKGGLTPVARWAPGAVLAAALLWGCSGIKPYPNTLEKNLQVRTETKSGSAFSRVHAALGVHRVDERCQIEYEGTIDLDQPSVPVGVPTDRWSYLVFAFSSSSFLGGSRSAMRKETLFRPRAGYSYDIAVSYKDDIYNVVIVERPPRGGAGREIEFRDLGACKSG